MPAPTDHADFGPFRLFASERRLVRDDKPVLLGSRALDILLLLVERAGSLVTKQELIARVWPGITVQESGLRVHIAALRKALGDGQEGARYIANVAGRGYCFVGQIAHRDASPDLRPPGPGPERAIPRRSAPMIGRDEDAGAISELLAERRFVTVHGPGGIGKTTIALAVANGLQGGFADGVRFLDLGLRNAREPVPDMLAAALGLIVQASDPTPGIVNYLRDRRMLLVLDCCEHVIESAAALAEALFLEAPRVSILATSREPLRAEGEHVYPLPSLGIPPEGTELSAEELLNFPAPRLFLERAAASGHRGELNQADAQVVADICRKVDGIALALELAAGRVSTHGLWGTAALLDSRMKLLWQGRRTALPRHQTLTATLDWSHELIPEGGRTVLRRLSVFVGPFTLDEAQAVAADDGGDGAEVVEALADLVAKSLVFADTSGAITRYRLLDTTRAYAQAKLTASGEEAAVARRHALYYRARQARAGAGPRSSQASADALGAEHLGNIRAALEWCFSATGDRELAVQLAAEFARLFLQYALLAECRRWSERALKVMGEDLRGSWHEMALRAALGYSQMFTRGNSDQARASLEQALEIAERLDDRHHQFRLLTALHIFQRRMGDFSQLLTIARRLEAIAPSLADATAIVVAQVMLGVSHHLTGDLAAVRAPLLAALHHPASTPRMMTEYHSFHHEAPFILARNLWLQGFPDQALAAVQEADGLEEQDPVATCLALIWGGLVIHWSGDWARVEARAERLIRHAGEHSLEPHKFVGVGFKGDALVRRGEQEGGLRLLREALASLHAERYALYARWLSCTLAECLAARGHLDQALGVMNEVIGAMDHKAGAYNMPELLRVRGVLLAQAGDDAAAERHFRESIAMADAQTALSWRLRSATSFARLRSRPPSRDEARALLAETYARYAEGFGTADLKAARQLLDELEGSSGGR